ncbi:MULTISPECIES: urease accessory protein UreH domain-containing protein [Bacillus]|uniref:urease accessory protein UreH domain-containing protein n=1 Tax=Bacillus TaxID=1386 RepID=UPI001C9314DF|nr:MULTISPECIES: sulfite exporter TauE/SafE family protein [Bacillus]MCU5335563.1 sulfite exporter TauE/SafE family protein [Bacillus cereus]MDF9539587.1 sulfite exporter TauE/SafE family protein [Bacillus cereus]MDF9585123.1 sulfite exporter TauE/SafE family protein [Bacillus cereus]MDG1594188.1 sulfite exporter TauE/SafE family protein [Bacillus cereus]MDZ4555142.1 sulfite exporter TauE/SafE family protein [Bacillus cereus]
MFSIISEWSYQLMSPLMDAANATKSVPLLFAFLLGIVGTLAPCQLTGNISAITLYSNQSLQKGHVWKHILLFILGKIMAFTTLGLLVWFLGKEIQQILTLYFPWLRKMMGPLLILMGLMLAGIIKARNFFSIKFIRKQNETGSFLLGFFFSLAFCPTMFVLFFGTLIPLSFSYNYGYLFPTFFSLGTALPIVGIMFIISYLGLNGTLLKKSRNIGKRVQQVAGVLLILIGLYDTALYW